MILFPWIKFWARQKYNLKQSDLLAVWMLAALQITTSARVLLVTCALNNS